MKLIIDIPEEIKKKRDVGKVLSSEEIATVCLSIKNGTPLPKGHGRLVDSDDMIADLQRQCKEVFKLGAVKPEDHYIVKDAKFMQATWKEWCDSFCVWANKRKAIIEADGGDEE